MKLEDYNRQQNAMELRSYGKHSPFTEPLEHLIDMLVRLDREAYLGIGFDQRVDEVCDYRNGYNPPEYQRIMFFERAGFQKI